MTYTLTFSKIIDNKRQPLHIDGREATIQVEADSRTGAIWHDKTVQFCKDHGCSVRSVSP